MNVTKFVAGLLVLVCIMPAVAQLSHGVPQHNGRRPSIGARPDGISYRVVSTTEVLLPAAVYCGFNDLGLPNGGIFERQVRRYEEVRGGKVVRTWSGTVDRFFRCAPN